MVFCCQGLMNREDEQRSVHKSSLRRFTLMELQSAKKILGQSSETWESRFESVCMDTRLTEMGIGINVAVKPVIKAQMAVKPVIKAQMGTREWDAELRRLEKIEHQNLVKLIGYCNPDSGNERFLVYEYLPNRSLDCHLSSLSWTVRLEIAIDAATGLAYLHQRKIIFKDFKPSNILLDNQMNAKLSYFGRVREAPHVSKSGEGTEAYLAPEYVQKGRLTTKIDVWSYGIFLQELITGEHPVAEENRENNPECMTWVCCNAGAGMSKLVVDPRLEGKYYEESVQKVASIANKCLVLEPKRRPKMSAVLKMVKEAINKETSA